MNQPFILQGCTGSRFLIIFYRPRRIFQIFEKMPRSKVLMIFYVPETMTFSPGHGPYSNFNSHIIHGASPISFLGALLQKTFDLESSK